MPRIQFPNVPKAPGVPQLNRSNAFPSTVTPAIVGAAGIFNLLRSFLSPPVWGIFRDKSADEQEQSADIDPETGEQVELEIVVAAKQEPVIVPDTFLTFGFRSEYAVSDAPTERGGFASYNKVANPYEIQMRLFKSGTVGERKAFLESIEKIVGDTNLYKIITPERTYLRVNLLRYEVMREEERGAYQLNAVDIFFREIRIVQAEYTNTATNTQAAQQPAATGVVNVGTVQATPPNGAVAGAAAQYVAQGVPP
jgi:hypothetical protein